MKRTWAAAVMGTVLVASLAIGPTASAGPLDCVVQGPSELPSAGAVVIENGKITIYPELVDDQGLLWAEFVLDVVACIDDGSLGAVTGCAKAKVGESVGSLDPANLDLRYVHVDPETGAIVVDYALLVRDATACLP